jgi:MoxR-like ATPase
MISPVPSARFDAAGARFVAFFQELGRTFVEREELLTQIALALLSREHVLMTGPPGTAKSGIASAVLRRVVDEASGAPSIFARQFTESTVQTDLVGPINFKTLMETGRTEHFTDEGMLGAVHAFLDEVFDGRDMLLRSTLNVLQERELKQGTKTTRGQIECALMTTNRYLAEVLEGSRETLLAFVDRIAFVAFVPKGFASTANLANVLKRQVGTSGVLGAELTIQDLDALQAVVDQIAVPDEVLDGLAKLIGILDEELAAAERGDPDFLPTRYLSTRTAVRLGKILRAACVFDRLFFRKDRALEVEGNDLRALSTSLILAGPQPDALASIFAKETDARERRQLAIVRTEREVFQRAISKVLPLQVPKKKASKEAKKVASVTDPAKLETRKLVEVTRALAEVTSESPERTQQLLDGAVRELMDRALRANARSSSLDDTSAENVIDVLARLADEIEPSSATGRVTARWLRGRAAQLVTRTLELGGATLGATLDDLRTPPAGVTAALVIVDKRLERTEKLKAALDRLIARGADVPADLAAVTARLLERTQADVAAILDLGFQRDVANALGANTGNELEALLVALAKPIDVLEGQAQRLARLGLREPKLKSLVVSPRIVPLVEATFARVKASDRVKLVAQVDKLLALLEARGLRDVLQGSDLIALVARVIVRTAEASPAPATTPLEHAQYRKLRKEDQRVPGAFTLLDVALRLHTATPSDDPKTNAIALALVVQKLPEEAARAVAALDLARLERSIAFLERWGAELFALRGTAEERIHAFASAGYFHVLTDEQALLRLALEIEIVGEVFPFVRPELEAKLARVRTLEATATANLRDALGARATEAWSTVLEKR